MHRNKKALLYGILCSVLIGMAIGIALPANLSARRRPASLSEVAVADGESIEPLGSKATPSDVLDVMTASHERWQSLYAVVDIEVNVESDVAGSGVTPRVATEEVWLGEDNRARIVATDTTDAGSSPTLVAVSDGKQYIIYNPVDNTYFAAEIPKHLQQEEDPTVSEDIELPAEPVIFPHPMTMLVPARSLSYLFSTGLGQSLRQFDRLTVLGTEQVGNQDASILDAQLSQNGKLIKHMRLWVDQESGVILKAQHFSADSEIWQLQVTVREISFNSKMSPALFSLELPTDATRLDSPVGLLK